jgi:hypothetical protein
MLDAEKLNKQYEGLLMVKKKMFYVDVPENFTN